MKARKIPRSQAQAYAEFLMSERIRHQEDIIKIDEKLEALERKGIISPKIGPWITTEEILEAEIE